jgi:hypothetical protein
MALLSREWCVCVLMVQIQEDRRCILLEKKEADEEEAGWLALMAAA